MKVSPTPICLTVLIIAGLASSANAQSNNFFGSGLGGPSTGPASGPIGGVNESVQGAGQVANQGGFKADAGTNNPPAGEYSQDEKRMQHKYKSFMASAHKLVSKGEEMMRSKDEKVAKKGKILKEIGEKRIAELRANSPFPELAAKDPKKVN
jgi:hypothetical protein